MSTITKERVAGIASGGKCYTHDDVVELARIALASLEAEAVAWMVKDTDTGEKIIRSDRSCFEGSCQPLYTAPPAQVSVPDDVIAAMQKVARIRLDLNDFDGDKRGILDCLSDAEEALIEVVNRRAAMLQGAEAVTTMTSYKLRDAVDAIRNSGIAIDAEKILAERDALNAPDCWCRTCRPVTMTDMRFVVCPECGNKRCPHANDHRNACTGSNEPGQEGSAYPAAPLQEVKP